MKHLRMYSASVWAILACEVHTVVRIFTNKLLISQVLKTMVGSNLTEKQLQEIVDKTILYADKDGDGKICFEEFCDVCYAIRSLLSHIIFDMDMHDYYLAASVYNAIIAVYISAGCQWIGCSIKNGY